MTELQRRAIPIRGGARHPIGARPTDFETAHRIIAVSRREHEPMLREHFPEVLERIQFFEIGDLDVAHSRMLKLKRDKHRPILDVDENDPFGVASPRELSTALYLPLRCAAPGIDVLE